MLLDNGAHYIRCDFQVHTPKDINWGGHRPTTDEERREFAVDFIRCCRERGIGGVAITDHHDMTFIRYIREAAQAERDSDGNELHPRQRLTVFPGMELSLHQPCQALLLFDADFPEDLFNLAMSALGIVQSDPASATTAPTEQLNWSLQDVCDRLNGHDYLRGRYILFPNVTEGGYKTLMREGFHGQYAAMPCVGGYTDGSVDRHGAGTRRILDGKIQQWGFKRLGLFQTSDCRHRDLEALGQHSTWVKWAEPTAEALRQACLARESRLCHAAPSTPQTYITSISVSNSKFLGPLSLLLNPQYNAIIGGRGTGKSTILEYLRWALCDEPMDVADDMEATDYRTRRHRLVDRTLIKLEATVQVSVMKNGVSHTVRRIAAEQRLLLKIGEGEFEVATEEQIRSLLPVQAYSQKQLSSVGVRLEQLQRFVQDPIRDLIDGQERETTRLSGQIRENHARLVRQRRLVSERAKLDREAQSVGKQVEVTRNGLTGVSPEDQVTIAQKRLVDAEAQAISTWERQVESSRQSVEAVLKASDVRLTRPDGSLGPLPHQDQLDAIQSSLAAGYAEVRSHIRAAEAAFSAMHNVGSPVGSGLAAIKQAHAAFNQRYQEARARSSTQQSILTQLSELESRLEGLRSETGEHEESIRSLGAPDAQLPRLFERWREGFRALAEQLQERCTSLTELSDGMIRATLVPHSDFNRPTEEFSALLRGSNIRSGKVVELFKSISESEDPLQHWAEVLGELEELAFVDKPVQDGTSLPRTPLLQQKFSPQDLLRIAGKLTPEQWVGIALCPVESTPRFEYRAREAEYIPFSEASAGQQATALLWALLNQAGPPLIVDQPEDDLDSQIIVRIVEQVWKAKCNRQLVFTSHNANLVVNGDAELVACCDYRVAGEQSSGQVKLEGAIDVPSIRDEITKVMEGGKEAFKLRKDKYGF